jgi:hypothetical protein
VSLHNHGLWGLLTSGALALSAKRRGSVQAIRRLFERDSHARAPAIDEVIATLEPHEKNGLRPIARERIANGLLPHAEPSRMWGGYGTEKGPAGKVLTPSAVMELRRLFELLADVAAAAAQTLKTDVMPSGLSAEEFKVLNARAADIVGRVRAILG